MLYFFHQIHLSVINIHIQNDQKLFASLLIWIQVTVTYLLPQSLILAYSVAGL